MPALSFKKQFAELVESGKKRQTIRRCRKDGRNVKPGDKLYFYTGMRTKSCRKLGEAVCIHSWPIYMYESERSGPEVFVDANRLAWDEIEVLAKADGFADAEKFFDFFKGNMPFHGYIIRW